MDRSNDRLNVAFAAVLRARRAQAGLTQEELAARADMSARHLSFLETARRQPSLSALLALSEGLGIGLSDLTSEVEQRYRQDSNLR